ADQKEVISAIRPVVPHDEVEKRSARVQAEGLRHLGLLSGDLEKIIQDRAYQKFTVHGVSHWVGLDVHDVGKYRIGGESRKLEPRKGLTVEPGIYISPPMAGGGSKGGENRGGRAGRFPGPGWGVPPPFFARPPGAAPG